MKSIAQEWQLMAVIRIVFLANPPPPPFLPPVLSPEALETETLSDW